MTETYIFSNLLVALAYFYVGYVLMPILPVRKITMVMGIAFFMLCAMTHLDTVYHTIWEPETTYGQASDDLHMLLIHGPQGLTAWAFAITFIQDMQRLQRERHTTEPAEK